MDVVRQQVTADELLLMPDDGFRYELDDLGAAYAAETGFRLSSDPDTVRAPDVAFVSPRPTSKQLARSRVSGLERRI